MKPHKALGEPTRDFLEKLANTEKKALDFDRMIELVEMDLKAIEMKYKINYVIDYSEIHRYLHPVLDRLRRVDFEKYRIEQLVLHYLFEVSDERLLLLDEYYEEFKARLNVMIKDFRSIYTSEWKTRRSEEIQNLIQNLMEKADLDENKVSRNVRGRIEKFAFDLLVDKNAIDSIQKDAKKFEKLLRNGKLYFIYQRKDIQKKIHIEENSKEFRDTWLNMVRQRPDFDRYWNNRTDAIAALVVKQLTEQNVENGQLFVLISSSPRIEPAFLSVQVNWPPLKKKAKVPILRNLIYILLRYYYAKWSFDKALEDIRQVRDLLREYLSLVADFSSHALDVPVSRIAELEQKVSECLWRFEKAMIDEIDFEVPEAKSELTITKSVMDVIKDPIKFGEVVRDAYLALQNAIARLEQLRVIYGFADS